MNQPGGGDGTGAWSRRGFVRTLLFGSVASAVAGRPWKGGWVASVTAGTPGGPGLLRLRLADFPPLQADFGSVRLGFTAVGQSGPMPPILFTRDGSRYRALSAECTHQGCPLTAFPSSRVTTCSCHGSRFDSEGEVVRGPAAQPLESFFVMELEPGWVGIELPGFESFAATVERVETAGGGRVALKFRAVRNVQYEVQATEPGSGSWRVVTFSTTPSGSADRAVFTGTGADATLYVERTGESGMLAVAAKIRSV